MVRIKVVLGVTVGEEMERELQALSPSIDLKAVGDLVGREIRLLRGDPGSPEQKQATAELDAAVQDAEVLLSSFRLPENVPGRTPMLKWVQSMGAGVERIVRSGLPEAGVILTNARGVAARPIADRSGAMCPAPPKARPTSKTNPAAWNSSSNPTTPASSITPTT